MTAYYNEIDLYAAQWLRNLIAAGHIAPGDVDTRSIEDVRPDELRKYKQCHFFAGIGVWSYALRRAGWPDDQAAWTGSCPCQPFSAAGKGAGFTDERHLWPAWEHLIAECQPAIVFGEQVASKDSEPWIDLVHTDMEALGYAFGAIPFPTASLGAPHMRDRLYFVADHAGYRRAGQGARGQAQEGSQARSECLGQLQVGFEGCGVVGSVERTECDGSQGRLLGWANEARPDQHGSAGRDGAARGLENHSQLGLAPLRQHHGSDDGRLAASAGQAEHLANDASQRRGEARPTQPESVERLADGGAISWANATQGFWGDADWLYCKDGRWRAVEPCTFPLVDGAANRVGRLRAYGNAINSEQAAVFIASVMEATA